MLKKYQEVKWTAEARNSFEKIKLALAEAAVLVSPDFSTEFLTFSFASEDTLAVVLLQKNNDGLEQAIAFFSKTLRDSELKYNTLEKERIMDHYAESTWYADIVHFILYQRIL